MSSAKRFQIKERFQITGRGTVVVIGETTELPVGKALCATVTRPDSSQLTAEAFKEWLLRRDQQPLESEAYLLSGIDESDVPEGCFVEIEFAR